MWRNIVKEKWNKHKGKRVFRGAKQGAPGEYPRNARSRCTGIISNNSSQIFIQGIKRVFYLLELPTLLSFLVLVLVQLKAQASKLKSHQGKRMAPFLAIAYINCLAPWFGVGEIYCPLLTQAEIQFSEQDSVLLLVKMTRIQLTHSMAPTKQPLTFSISAWLWWFHVVSTLAMFPIGIHAIFCTPALKVQRMPKLQRMQGRQDQGYPQMQCHWSPQES